MTTRAPVAGDARGQNGDAAMTSFVIHVREMADHPNAVYIGRQNNRMKLKASALANPFTVRRYGRAEAISRYHLWLGEQLDQVNRDVILALMDCRGKPLACWCRAHDEPKTPDNLCHGDLLVIMLDEMAKDPELNAAYQPIQDALDRADRLEGDLGL